MIIDTHTHFTIRPGTKFGVSFEENLKMMEAEMKEAV